MKREARLGPGLTSSSSIYSKFIDQPAKEALSDGGLSTRLFQNHLAEARIPVSSDLTVRMADVNNRRGTSESAALPSNQSGKTYISKILMEKSKVSEGWVWRIFGSPAMPRVDIFLPPMCTGVSHNRFALGEIHTICILIECLRENIEYREEKACK